MRLGVIELASQAYRNLHPGPDPYGEANAAWSGVEPFERELARLIVEECEDVLAAEFDQYDAILSPGDLRKHFGIKQ